jgi:hypothetical protein
MSDSGVWRLNFHPAARNKSAIAAETPGLIVRTCRHIGEAGDLCRAAAVGGRAYCRAHQRLRVRDRKTARARHRAEVLKLPALVNLQAVEAATARVRAALADEHIDAGLARLLRWGMRQAATDLRFIEQQAAVLGPFSRLPKGVLCEVEPYLSPSSSIRCL